MQPTEAQQRAIDTRQTAIVVAGAGSGKTRVLVERYLALLAEHRDWALNNLVAITFTRKAAAEMRARVRTSLEQRYRQALAEANHAVIEHWSLRIAEMDSARITTIHGLCSDLLRANFAEAGLDPDFQVLDDADAAQLRADAVDLAFSQLTHASDLPADVQTNILELFETYDMQRMRDALLKSDVIGADVDALVNHAPVADPASLMARWQGQWEADAGRVIDQLALNNSLLAFASDQTGFVIPSGDKIALVWRDTQTHLQQCFDSLNTFKERVTALSIAKDEIVLRGGSAKNWGDQETFDAAKELLREVKVRLETCVKDIGEPPADLDREAARLLPAWYALITRVQQTYIDLKTQRAALDFDDLESRAMALLEQHPEVVARYQGSEIRHLLIDEFQDTNQRQWRIAQQIAPPTTPGALFVVGDPKQSIYAFRGADVSVFGSVHETIRLVGGDAVDLARSFRTHAPLVERFNAIFERILVTDDTSPVRAYQVALGQPMDAHRQTPPESPDSLPAIELLLLDKDQGEATKKLSADELRRWEAQVIAERLNELVASERLIYDKERGVTRLVGYGDIALLVQAMTHVTTYESVFRQMGIPYITAAGRGYYDRQEVHDVMNLLHALYNPVDHLALASALHSPLFGLSDEALYALRTEISADGRRPEPRPLWQALQWQALESPGVLLPDAERETVRFAAACLVRWQQMAGRVTISELLETLFDETGYLATLTGLPDGALRRGNVMKLLDKARASGKITLSDFTAYIRDLSTSEVREGDAAQDVEGVAQIMTIHASKGLEFPVVVLLDAAYKRRSSGFRDGRDTLLFHDELICKVMEEGKATPPFAYRRSMRLSEQRADAEHRRLLYVAATRAQDLLIVSGAANPVERSADGWLGWLLAAIDSQHPLIHESAPVYRGTGDAKPDDVKKDDSHRSASDGSSVFSEAQSDQEAEPSMPPLLPPVRVFLQHQARHLAATSIADMGGWLHAEDAQEQQGALERFRRRVLYDAPAVIQRVQPHTDPPRVSARQVGDIVHQALRWWPLPFDIEADARLTLLSSYAWTMGITDDRLLNDAAQQASELLNRFTQSALYRWITAAQAAGMPVLRELPFVYEQESYIVHGVMDLLFQRPTAPGEAESWVLADYKTARMRRWEPNAELRYQKLETHATRYHLQLGIYAAAAEQILSAERPCVPEVYLHYLSYNTSIHLSEAMWRGALADGLDASVEQLIRRRERRLQVRPDESVVDEIPNPLSLNGDR